MATYVLVALACATLVGMLVWGINDLKKIKPDGKK